MQILRLVLAWLIMAALPLQGFAAASMLFCGPAGHSTVAQQAGHDHASHDHAASSHEHASSSHGADSHHNSATDVDEKYLQQQADGSKAGNPAGDGHACPICASCCNLVALSEPPTLSLDADPPRSQPHRGSSRVLTRHAPTPDKPPRA